jgi:hypothetical protein
MQENGATPTTDFINGRLFEALLARTQTIVPGTAVPAPLKAFAETME